MNDFLNKTRDELASSGTSEVGIVSDTPGAENIWKEIQAIKKEMNDAKKIAAEKAAKPYLKKLKELEEQYIFVLKLSQ